MHLALPEHSRRDINELTEEEIERLRLHNRKLAEAEAWIRQRRDRCLADYYRAGGVGGCGRKHCYSDELWEGVEIEVEVARVLREDHPDFDEDDENIVAELNWMPFARTVDNPENRNWNAFQFHPGHRLAGDHHCRLFQDLYDHRLHCDWDRVLGIGTVWIDVHLIQQRGWTGERLPGTLEDLSG